MAPGASKPISYWFSFSCDKQSWRKWPQELPSLLPIWSTILKEIAPGTSRFMSNLYENKYFWAPTFKNLQQTNISELRPLKTYRKTNISECRPTKTYRKTYVSELKPLKTYRKTNISKGRPLKTYSKTNISHTIENL